MISLAGLIVLMLPCVWLDVRSRELPVVYMLIFTAAAAAVNALFHRMGWIEMMVGFVTGLLFVGISFLSRGGIGAGDGLLILALGVWCGFSSLVPMLILAFLLTAIVGGILVWTRRSNLKLRMPLAPFLGIAGVIQGVLLIAVGSQGVTA